MFTSSIFLYAILCFLGGKCPQNRYFKAQRSWLLSFRVPGAHLHGMARQHGLFLDTFDVINCQTDLWIEEVVSFGKPKYQVARPVLRETGKILTQVGLELDLWIGARAANAARVSEVETLHEGKSAHYNVSIQRMSSDFAPKTPARAVPGPFLQACLAREHHNETPRHLCTLERRVTLNSLQ